VTSINKPIISVVAKHIDFINNIVQHMPIVANIAGLMLFNISEKEHLTSEILLLINNRQTNDMANVTPIATHVMPCGMPVITPIAINTTYKT